MKFPPHWVPALVLAVGLTTWYALRARYETNLMEQLRTRPVAAGQEAIRKESALLAAFPETPLPMAARQMSMVRRTPSEGKRLLAGIMDSLAPPGTQAPPFEESLERRIKEKTAPLSPEQLAALLAGITASRQSTPLAERDPKREMIENSVEYYAGDRLGKEPPATILAALDGLDLRHTSYEHRLITTAVGEMAKTDPAAAWSWIQRQPDAQGETSLWSMYAVLKAASGGDAFKWLELAETCGRAREVILNGLRTAVDSPLFREAWLEKVVEYRGTDAAKDILSLTAKLHDAQGFEAARDFVDSHPALPGRDQLIRSLASSHLSGGGAAKADWLISVSSPENLEGDVRHLMQSWTAKDPAAAAAWLNAAPPDAAWLDPALKAFSNAIAPHDAEAARVFAARIANPLMRGESVSAITR